MSRIGKKPILIPDGVEISIKGNLVTVRGPKGELQREVRPEIRVEKREGEIFISPQRETKPLAPSERKVKYRAFWGLTRTLIFNMVKGVTDGYEKKLQIEGIGYKANLEGENLILHVGFSHSVEIKQPQGINFLIEKNIITVSGIDKELVGQTTAKIRRIRPPEPYKGKGIRYLGEHVRRKAGKKAAVTTM